MARKNIIVVDDEPLIAVLMKEVIAEDPLLQISMITTSKEEFLTGITRQPFDAALVDISVGGREGGLELLQAIKTKGLDLPVIILSAHDELHYALKCLKAGARGYISKRYICTDVITCVKRVLEGDMFVSGDKGESILKQYRQDLAAIGS